MKNIESPASAGLLSSKNAQELLYSSHQHEVLKSYVDSPV